MEQQQFLKYYQNFVSYCKTAFPSIPAPFYTEWLRDTNLIFPSEPPLLPTAYSQQLPPNKQDCHISYYNNSTEAPTELSDSIDTTQSSCNEQKKKRENWCKQQTAILVNTRKNKFRCFGNVQTSKCTAKNKTAGQTWVAQITEANQIKIEDFK